jgi:Fe-S-cluster containining protein
VKRTLPVVQPEQKLVECTDCGRCCTYVGISINGPTSARYATDVLWYLYHENTYVYRDGDGEWSLHFESRCKQLGDDLLCRIYADRPHICRGFDHLTCEVNDSADEGTCTFRQPAEFLAWLREKKPKLAAKIEQGFVPKALRAAARRAPRRARRER